MLNGHPLRDVEWSHSLCEWFLLRDGVPSSASPCSKTRSTDQILLFSFIYHPGSSDTFYAGIKSGWQYCVMKTTRLKSHTMYFNQE